MISQVFGEHPDHKFLSVAATGDVMALRQLLGLDLAAAPPPKGVANRVSSKIKQTTEMI